MVKLQILSDLHIETLHGIPKASDYVNPQAEILIMAGDIGRLNRIQQLEPFLKDISSYFHTVLYVLGNHEFYRDLEKNEVKAESTDKTYDELLQDAFALEKEIKNLHILYRKSVLIDNVCIAGCTLWSQPTTYIPSYRVRIRDMNTEMYTSLHNEDVKYIKRMIRYCAAKNIKLVMISHHCPSYTLLSEEKWKKDKFKCLYASELDYMLDRSRIHTWIYGHTHENVDTRSRNGTKIVTNQKGKFRDKIQDFSKEKIVIV